MSSCSHLQALTHLQPPRLSQPVHREECTQCFDNQDSSTGVDVCLACFNGGCSSPERHHAQTHVRKTGHTLTLNVKRRPKPNAQRAEDDEPPAKIKKLAIVEDRDEDKYNVATTIKCWKCDPTKGLELPADPLLNPFVDSVMNSLSSARQSEVKAWEEDITPCEHTLMLEQRDTGHIAQSGLAHCGACDLKENLWLCLACGSLGCGRKQYGGVPGGNGHGLAHFEATGHAVSVKLGTITAEGDADIYCYECNDAKQDPDLAPHLKTFGINVGTLTKTEKSMTELQIEQNLRYDFSLVNEEGEALQPAFGPGLTGLANLGNSCYMASVIQVLFCLPAFQERYFKNVNAPNHSQICDVALPADCVECQMLKVADGLLSGRYSNPANYAASNENFVQHPSTAPVFQAGLRPVGFKSLVGKGHEEFSTMKQQDSEEFLGHLLAVVRRDSKKWARGDDATKVFSHALEQRLQCNECKKVRYRTDEMDLVSIAVPAREKSKDMEGKVEYEEVGLTQCLDALLGTEGLEYGCSSCGKNVTGLKQIKFASFPQVLVVHAKKFQLVNWVPTKLDIPIILPADDMIQFTAQHLGTGLQIGEEELPNDDSAQPALPEFSKAAMDQLEGMGFPTIQCQKALLATGNSDANAAMEWLFLHMEDPDIDSPIVLASLGGAGPEPDEGQVTMLADMGFTPAQAKKALRETGGDPERAVEWLFSHPHDSGESLPPTSTTLTATIPGSTIVPVRYRLKAFISHKGPSVHSGHYVAHIQLGEGREWVLFNDEKVVRADGENVRDLKRLAYLYVFERV